MLKAASRSLEAVMLGVAQNPAQESVVRGAGGRCGGRRTEEEASHDGVRDDGVKASDGETCG